MTVQKVPLGTSGICVSKLCLGTMTFGSQTGREECFQLLDYAVERGINFIDTAESYPVTQEKQTGISETIIGEWLK
ncbi:MAG: aldo/keto reductase, partial [Burkholderiaceae bacterium]|nr:aldo/keto reductase [Burkholderiaceae bacterium]